MTAFYFNVVDCDGFMAADHPYDFPDMAAAVAQAETVLSEMATDGLPFEPNHCLQVEVLNDHRIPVARLTLALTWQYFPQSQPEL